MFRSTSILALSIALLGGQVSQADVPNVVTDIPPVQSLVAQVMGDLGAPSAIVPTAANAHGFALRPSDARNLADADVVFWMGAELIPALDRAIDTLAGGAAVVGLLGLDETVVIEVGADNHDDHADEAHDDHGHNDHASEAHDDHGHDNHDADRHDEENNHDDHDHGGIDPHAWMSPGNAQVWLDVIAATLSKADPENASQYSENAATARADLTQLTATLTERAKTGMGPHVVVTFHDTLRYFEDTFDTGAVVTIPLGDGLSATPSQLADLRAEIAEHDPKCALTDEVGETTGMTAMAQEAGLELVVLNPLGAGLEPGASLYSALIQRTFDTLLACRK